MVSVKKQFVLFVNLSFHEAVVIPACQGKKKTQIIGGMKVKDIRVLVSYFQY
jgi:hypothetical protein